MTTDDTPPAAPADPHEALTFRCCECEPLEASTGGFLCTQPRSHAGPHVATGPGGRHIYATWDEPTIEETTS